MENILWMVWGDMLIWIFARDMTYNIIQAIKKKSYENCPDTGQARINWPFSSCELCRYLYYLRKIFKIYIYNLFYLENSNIVPHMASWPIFSLERCTSRSLYFYMNWVSRVFLLLYVCRRGLWPRIDVEIRNSCCQSVEIQVVHENNLPPRWVNPPFWADPPCCAGPSC